MRRGHVHRVRAWPAPRRVHLPRRYAPAIMPGIAPGIATAIAMPPSLGDLGRFSVRRVVNRVTAPVQKIAAPVTRPLQKITAPVVMPVSRIVSHVNDLTARRVVESDAARKVAIKTAVSSAQAGLIVGGSFLGPAGTAGGALAAQALSAGLGPQYGQGWAVRGISVGQIAGGVATGGVAALIPAALQTGVSLLADRGGSTEASSAPMDAAPIAMDATSMPAASDLESWPGSQPDGAMPPADASGIGVMSGRSAYLAPGEVTRMGPDALQAAVSGAPAGRAAMVGRSALPPGGIPASSGSSKSFVLPLLVGGAVVAVALLVRAAAAAPHRRHR